MVSKVTLRHRLILFRYILSLFGVSDITSLRETLKREKETYDSDGKSYYFNALKGLNLNLMRKLLLSMMITSSRTCRISTLAEARRSF
jgi:hypothetical protein